MKVVVLSGACRSLILFRKHLLRGFRDVGYEVVAVAPDRDALTVETLESLGIRFVQIPYARTGLNPLADWAYLSRLKAFLRTEQPDRLFAYTIKAMLYGGVAARWVKLPRVDLLVSGVGSMFADGEMGFWKRCARALWLPFFRYALRDTCVLFFQNKDDVTTYRQHALISEETEVVVVPGSGVDLDEFRVEPLPKQGTRFCMIGRLIREKGVFEYAQAASILKNRYGAAVEFCLVGPEVGGARGVESVQLQAWISSGVIQYLGEVEDVRPALTQVSVYVLPSYYMEGVPRSILEALAMGRAIVTTDHRGCRETVKHGENGLLVPPRDVAALVSAMERFVLEPELAGKMGIQSRELAKRQFDVIAVTRMMLESMDVS